MSFDYAELASTALEILTEFGQDVTLRLTIPGTYDPATSSVVNTSSDSSRKGALINFDQGVTEFQGTLVQKSDKLCILDAIGPSPAADALVIVGVLTYSIVSFQDVNPAGAAVLYMIHLHR